jgi:hypothetical protein
LFNREPSAIGFSVVSLLLAMTPFLARRVPREQSPSAFGRAEIGRCEEVGTHSARGYHS